MRGEYAEILAMCDQVDALQVNLASAMVAMLTGPDPLASKDEIVACQRGIMALSEAQGRLKDAAYHLKGGE